jgi:hypothetical protein
VTWLIWPPLALVLLAYPWLLHGGHTAGTALTLAGALLAAWAATCGSAAVLRTRAPRAALALALLWAPVSLIAILIVGVATFEASGL